MADPSKAPDEGTKSHTIRWDLADWEQIEKAAVELSEREHLDLSALDIIRSGARRFALEVLHARGAA